MPTWLTITLAIIGALGTIFGAVGLTAYFTERAKHKAQKKNQREDEEEARALKAEREHFKNDVREVLREENKPLEDKIDQLTTVTNEMKGDLADNTVGTVTILRDRMKAILDDCRDKGYASPGTKANWHELYTTYGNLGGNHFREYVDQWKTTLDNLPDNPPVDHNGNPIMNGIIYPNGLRPSQVAPSARARRVRAPRGSRNNGNNN